MWLYAAYTKAYAKRNKCYKNLYKLIYYNLGKINVKTAECRGIKAYKINAKEIPTMKPMDI